MTVPETPTFEAIGFTLVKCDINPSKCPVRKIRQNPHLAKVQHMCQHSNAPKVSDDTLRNTGFIYRTCITTSQE